jgi:LuxR family maltose regulon positive regulatory protein
MGSLHLLDRQDDQGTDQGGDPGGVEQQRVILVVGARDGEQIGALGSVCAIPGNPSGAVMASQLVDTKLFVPSVRGSSVARSRLSQTLSRGAEAKLTLVSAPAGFGKTTALAAWLAQADRRRAVAWLSLEESERQPAAFWTYLVTALHRAAPSVGAGVLPLLQSAQPSIENVLTTVLNELGTLPHDLDLVLDDYHLADGPEVAAGMAFLIEHLPPPVHMVISSRVDPDLPLARLRARANWSRCAPPTCASRSMK